MKEEYNILQNPAFILEDSVEFISDAEHRLLGTSITCSKVDGCDILNANTTCREIKDTLMEKILVACELEEINIVKTKSGKNPGQNMCFIKISDSTAHYDGVVCFPEQFKQYEHVLIPGNTILIDGNKSKDRDGLIVKKIWQL